MVFGNFLERCFEVLNCTSVTELAEYWATSPELIQESLKTGSLPGAWLILTIIKTDCDPMWLISGQGTPYGDKKKPPNKTVPRRTFGNE